MILGFNYDKAICVLNYGNSVSGSQSAGHDLQGSHRVLSGGPWGNMKVMTSN